jgi:calcineurin-like phosphoesterase family protein
MNYWWTSDYHFGHANIIRYCNRPFETVEEMNEAIIRKYNEVCFPFSGSGPLVPPKGKAKRLI